MFCCRPAKLFTFGGVVFAVGGGLIICSHLGLGKLSMLPLPFVCFALTVTWAVSAPLWLRHSRRDHELDSS